MDIVVIDKDKLLTTYRAASDEQKEILKNLYGKNMFPSDWREITSYEKACEVLGIQACEFKEVGDRPQYMRMANAVQQLLVICEAINGADGWYDKDGLEYYPVFRLYNKQEMDELRESKCKHKRIHNVLAVYNVNYAVWGAGISYTNTRLRSTFTNVGCGFPLCLNSEEKAKFVGEQFFELCCACYGITLKTDD